METYCHFILVTTLQTEYVNAEIFFVLRHYAETVLKLSRPRILQSLSSNSFCLRSALID